MLSAVSSCGVGMWPQEGEVWWSRTAGRASKHQDGIPMPISEEALQDWLADTVGWAGIELSAESFMAAAVHISQVKPLVLAAFEAAARLNTHKCRFKQVDIDSTLARCVSMALAAYANIQVLVLQELNVYEEAVHVLTTGLRNSENLTKLSLQTVDLSAAGWEAIARAVAFSPSLRHLKIRGSFPRHALVAVSHGLKHCMMLQVLDVGSNPLGDHGITRLCDSMAHNSTVKTLKIQRCCFEAHGAGAVARLLRSSKHIIHLHLDHNELSAQGCLEIAKAVSASSSLQQLSASHTGWDDAAVQQLCASLSTCPSLSTLDLSFGRVGMKGSHLLSAAALKVNLVVVKLNGNCNIGTEGVKSWAQVIGMPKRPLAQLSLSDCEAADPAAFAIAGALRQVGDQGGLETLELASNHLTPSGVEELIKAVRCSPTMRMLDVSFNWLGPRAMAACLQAPPEEPSAEVTASSKPAGGSSFLSFLAPRPKKIDPPTQSSFNFQCEIKSEVLQEFREIEQIKISEWPQVAPASQQQQQREEQQQPQEDVAGGSNPFLAVGATGPLDSNGTGAQTSVGHAQAADQPNSTGQLASGEANTVVPPLRAGYAIPARLACSASASGNGSEAAVSTETFASSGRSSLGSVAGSVADSHSRQQGSDGGPHRHTSGAGVSEPVLGQLQGLQDGTINSELPVSLKPRESAGSAEFAVVKPQTPVRANAQVDATSTSPFATQPNSSAGGAQLAGTQQPFERASSTRYDTRDFSDGGSMLRKASSSSQQVEASDIDGRSRRPSALTSYSLRRLNQQLGPVSVGELLLLDSAKQQALVHSMGGDSTEQPAALPPLPQQMGLPAAASQASAAVLTSAAPHASAAAVPAQQMAAAKQAQQVVKGPDNPFFDPTPQHSDAGPAPFMRTPQGHDQEAERPSQRPAAEAAVGQQPFIGTATTAQQPTATEQSNPFKSGQPAKAAVSVAARQADNPFMSAATNGQADAGAHEGKLASGAPSRQQGSSDNPFNTVAAVAEPNPFSTTAAVAESNPFEAACNVGQVDVAREGVEAGSVNPFVAKAETVNPFVSDVGNGKMATARTDAASVNPFLAHGDVGVEDAHVTVLHQLAKQAGGKAAKPSWAASTKQQQNQAGAVTGETDNPFLRHEAAGNGASHGNKESAKAAANPFL